DNFSGDIIEAGGVLYILDDDAETSGLAGAGPSLAPIPPADDNAASDDEISQARNPATSSAPAADTATTAPESDSDYSKAQLMAMNKDELVALAAARNVTIDETATKDAISDAIVAAQ
ncbi:MAG: hypothetical protein ACRDKW_16035, partial [Actinomycetota bacterium]